jgi:putative DNA primase/helicase
MQPTNTRTANDAVGRWPGILQKLGIDQRFLLNKHGPCPVCGGKDRYRFDDKDGRGTWICSFCGAGDGFALLQRVFGWNFSHAAREVDRIVGIVQPGPIVQARTEENKVAALRAVWAASKAVTRGDPVWTYLNRRTGIEVVPPDIRFHPSLKHSGGGMHPTMVSMLRYPDNSGASIHRTYLTDDGQKARVEIIKKLMPGKPLQTASVRLGRVERHMGIGEGIETALAASRRFHVPVWAATSATLLASWVPPAGAEKIMIAGDNDGSWTGQAAAFALARRLTRDGYAVEVRIPGTQDRDWADVAT